MTNVHSGRIFWVHTAIIISVLVMNTQENDDKLVFILSSRRSLSRLSDTSPVPTHRFCPNNPDYRPHSLQRTEYPVLYDTIPWESKTSKTKRYIRNFATLASQPFTLRLHTRNARRRRWNGERNKKIMKTMLPISKTKKRWLKRRRQQCMDNVEAA